VHHRQSDGRETIARQKSPRRSHGANRQRVSAAFLLNVPALLQDIQQALGCGLRDARDLFERADAGRRAKSLQGLYEVERPIEGPDADEELAALAKAIGHPARVQILRLLVRRSSCVCGDIVDELPLAQSTVSQHLKVLKDAGLIRGEVDGPRVYYCIEPRALRRLKALVGGL